MYKGITKIEAEILILNECKKKNYTLIKNSLKKDPNIGWRFKIRSNEIDISWDSILQKFFNHDMDIPKLINKLKENQLSLRSSVHLITKKSNIPLICNKCGKDWNPRYSYIQHTDGKCPSCVGVKKYTNIEIKKDLLKKLKKRNYKIIYLPEYLERNTDIIVECLKHKNQFKTNWKQLVWRNVECPICGHEKTAEKKIKKTEKIALKKVLDTGKKLDLKLIDPQNFKYTGMKTKFKVECNKGHIFTVDYHGFIGKKRNRVCPKCKETIGERLISQYLDKLGIIYESEYTKLPELKYKFPLRVDFFISNNDNPIVIEFDGIGHFQPIDFFGGEKGFRSAQKRDKIKNDYCKNHNISMIRIKYTEDVEEVLNNRLLPLLTNS